MNIKQQTFIGLLMPLSATHDDIEIGRILECDELSMFAWWKSLDLHCANIPCTCKMRIARSPGGLGAAANDAKPLNTIRLKDGRLVSEPDGIRS